MLAIFAAIVLVLLFGLVSACLLGMNVILSAFFRVLPLVLVGVSILGGCASIAGIKTPSAPSKNVRTISQGRAKL